MNFLTNILEIFAQLGLKAKNTDDKTIKEPSKVKTTNHFSLHSSIWNISKVKANISGLLHLLLVIANVVDRMPVITDPSERVFLLFQRFWFYCVLYGFADAKGTKYPKMYVDSLRFIAMKSPILVVGHVSSITLKAAMPLRAEHLTKVTSSRLPTCISSLPSFTLSPARPSWIEISTGYDLLLVFNSQRIHRAIQCRTERLHTFCVLPGNIQVGSWTWSFIVDLESIVSLEFDTRWFHRLFNVSSVIWKIPASSKINTVRRRNARYRMKSMFE